MSIGKLQIMASNYTSCEAVVSWVCIHPVYFALREKGFSAGAETL